MFARTSAGGRVNLKDPVAQPSEDAGELKTSAALPEMPAPVVDALNPKDGNVALMGKDWGMNPPIAPARVSSLPQTKPMMMTKFQQESLGNRKRNGTMVKSHLPPPPLGVTSGHGLDLPYSHTDPAQNLQLRSKARPAAVAAPGGLRTANPHLLQQLVG